LTDETDTRADEIISDLRLIYGALHQLSVPTWLKLGLTMAQLKTLVAVQRAAGISVGELARQLSIGEPSASLLVEQLVRRDLAVRTPDPDDRRRVQVSASSLGEDLLTELRHGQQRSLAQWVADLDASDLDALACGLRALAEAAATHTAQRDEASQNDGVPA
jgi:DNA-binding MarR family transcriptional regulator